MGRTDVDNNSLEYLSIRSYGACAPSVCLWVRADDVIALAVSTRSSTTSSQLKHEPVMLALHRTALRRRVVLRTASVALIDATRLRHTPSYVLGEAKDRPVQDTGDPRVDELIEDAFATVKSSYVAPKHAIVLAHGLLGFDELRPAGHFLPGVEYWRGITQALAAKNVEVITAHVPPSGRIEVRAAKLAESIERQANGKAVNIIA